GLTGAEAREAGHQRDADSMELLLLAVAPHREQHVGQTRHPAGYAVEREDERARPALREPSQERAPSRDAEEHRRSDHSIELEILTAEREHVPVGALERVLVRDRRVPEAQRRRTLRRADAVDPVPQPA